MVKEITTAVRAFLEEKRFAVMATIKPDGSPQQTVHVVMAIYLFA